MGLLQELVELCEEYSAPGGERVLVVRVCADFFVARGHRRQSVATYKVSRPFESPREASRAAQELVKREWRIELASHAAPCAELEAAE